jgi:molecular chaperone DnaK (HSP70)
MSNRLNILFPNHSVLPEQTVRAIGIDLGTNNSTVAELEWTPGQDLSDVRCIEVEQSTTQGR